MTALDDTHRPDLTSWVPSAQADNTDFPIQNLPLGVFARRGETAARGGVAIGDQIVDVVACLEAGLLPNDAGPAARACAGPALNELASLGPGPVRALRRALSELLRADAPAFARDSSIGDRILVPMSRAALRVPVAVGDYTDFYASIFHATNVGTMLRPDSPLFPNYKWMPIGYHGRASSIVPSGSPVRRPVGQTREPGDDTPRVGPSRRLDYEIEIGAVVGKGNALGVSVPITDAEDHLFGLCLVNDWSARDIQTWEYQPLGPFLAKSFTTTMSPAPGSCG